MRMRDNELYCQVCLHTRGMCYSDRSSTVQQNDSDKTQIIKNNIQIGNVEEEEYFFLFVTYTIIQIIASSEMCFLHLTHPSIHTPGAVGRRRCGVRGAVGGSVPCSRVSVVDNSCQSRDSNPQPRVTSPTLNPLEPLP